MGIVIALSGGMDSCSLLSVLKSDDSIQSIYGEVKCLGFTYGSKHNKYEIEAAKKVAEHYDVEYRLIDISFINDFFKSNLLISGGEIPEGHYNDASMSQTVVPGRNLIFSSFLAGYAESIGYQAIGLGVHKGDMVSYPDCRKEFIKALDSCIYLSSNKKVEVFTPFIDMDKGEICNEGLFLDAPYHLTRSCYKDQPLSCGKCGTCVERLEAFEKCDTEDPIKYVQN